MSTRLTIETALRVRLNETSANEWSATQLRDYINRAYDWLAGWLASIGGSGRFVAVQTTLAIPASTELVATSGLSAGYTRVRAIEQMAFLAPWANRWVPMDPWTERDRWNLLNCELGGDPQSMIPRYRLLGANISFLPKRSVAGTVSILYTYLPTALAADADVLETPPEYDDILILRAAHYAGSDAGEVNTGFEAEYATRLGDIEGLESNRQQQRAGEFPIRQQTQGMFG